jgi:hypothetical protein
MGKPIPYNGHRSWNAWNIALWIGNDESLYEFAQDCLRQAKDDANKATTKFLKVYGGTRTPDGAVYTRIAVYKTLKGFAE